MFGFIVGGVCLAMLVAMIRRGFAYRRAWRYRPGGWRRYALYSLFERLDATPGQEKVISAALDELRETLRGLREKFRDSRRDVAGAFRRERLADEDVNGLFARFDEHLEAIRQAAGRAMQKVHEALDERQRGLLADLVERGGWGYGHGGGHGCGWHRGLHHARFAHHGGFEV